MGNKGNVVLYLDKELVEISKELGFNLSKTFENHLRHLVTQFSTCNSANNWDSTGKNVNWCGRRDLNPGSQAWKACVLNQLDDDRHSDTVVLEPEIQKAIEQTLIMLANGSRYIRSPFRLSIAKAFRNSVEEENSNNSQNNAHA